MHTAVSVSTCETSIRTYHSCRDSPVVLPGCAYPGGQLPIARQIHSEKEAGQQRRIGFTAVPRAMVPLE
jgi:hypothetical protein